MKNKKKLNILELFVYILKRLAFELFCGGHLVLLFFASLFKSKYKKLLPFYTLYLRDTRLRLDNDRGDFVAIGRNIKFLAVFVILLLIFVFFLGHFEGPNKGYWDTYITVPAMLMTKTPVEFVDINGQLMYEYELSDNILENLIDHKTYGIASKDQRLGSGIIASLPFLFLGKFGFRFMYALINTLIGVLVFFTLDKLFKNKVLSFFGSFLLLSNPYFLYVDRLNPNSLGLMVTALIVYLVIEEQKPWVIIGILFGILCGVRNVLILMLPALLFLVLLNKGQGKNMFKLVLGAALGLFPMLYWNYYAFNNPFIHSSQFAGFEGFRPVFEHNFLGLKFMFNGLLNWPFYDRIIRTPHFPFPTFISIPLVLIRSFGLISSSLVIVGFFTFFKQRKKMAVFLGIYYVLFLMMLAVQENWEELKLTYIILIFSIMIIYIISAIYAWLNAKNRLRFTASIISVMVVAILFVKTVEKQNFIADERWYQRFPKSALNLSGYEHLPDEERKGWAFFQTKESALELLQQREKLTKVSLLPQEYIRTGHDYKQEFFTLGTELNNRKLKIFEIWDWIYSDIEKAENE